MSTKIGKFETIGFGKIGMSFCNHNDDENFRVKIYCEDGWRLTGSNCHLGHAGHHVICQYVKIAWHMYVVVLCHFIFWKMSPSKLGFKLLKLTNLENVRIFMF